MIHALLRVHEEMAVTLTFRVEDPSMFTRLAIHKSVTGPKGPYKAITASEAEPAVLRSKVGTFLRDTQPVDLTGKTLEVLVRGHKRLTIPMPEGGVTLHELLQHIEDSSENELRAFLYGGAFCLRTRAEGRRESFELIGGEATSTLQLPLNTRVRGKDAAPSLQSGVAEYEYTDPFSGADHYYTSRLYNPYGAETSAFSPPIGVASRVVVPPEDLALGTLQLAAADGRPAKGVDVQVHYSSLGARAGSTAIVGSHGPLHAVTDADGRAEFQLVRGLEVTVAVGGTGFSRKVRVPTDTQVLSFDLLSPEYGEDDAFSVSHVPELWAERE